MNEVERKIDEMLAPLSLSRDDLTKEEFEQLREEAQMLLNGEEHVDGVLSTIDTYRKPKV